MRRDGLLGWALLAPSLVLLGTFVVLPVLLDVPLSLMQYDMIAATGRWVGMRNYAALAADPIFWQAVGHTLELALGTTVPLLVLAIVFGLVLNRRVRGGAVYRTILFVPPSMPAIDLLAKMQATHIHLALVIGHDSIPCPVSVGTDFHARRACPWR